MSAAEADARLAAAIAAGLRGGQAESARLTVLEKDQTLAGAMAEVQKCAAACA